MISLEKKSGFSSKRARLYFVCLMLVVSTAFAYWNVDKFGYIHFDDQDYVSKNFHIFSGFTKTSVQWAFTSFYAANWHPLTWLSHMLDYQLFGLRPAGHHLMSLLFHMLNTLLLFFAFRSLTGTFWRSALVAALFGLHPLHVESVAWVSERKDVLCALFMFIALLCYSSYVHRQRHKGFYFATLLFFMMGLMSKPMLVTFPFLLLLLDFWPLRRFEFEIAPTVAPDRRQRIYRIMPIFLEKSPFLFLSIGSCIITTIAQKSGGAISQFSVLPILFRLNNAIISYLEYILKTVWPTHLAFYYPLILDLPLSNWKLSTSIILLALVSYVAISRHKRKPFLLVGWLWFLGMLVPVIGIIQVGSQEMADRYTYVPLVGLFIIVAWLLCDLANRSRWLKIVSISGSVVVLLLLTYQTRIQASSWKNDLTLSNHALQVTKYNYLAYTMKGIYFYNSGAYDSALQCYVKSLSFSSTQKPPRLNIGCILLSQGRPKEAMKIFKELLKNDSTYAPAYLNGGKAYAALCNNDSAILYFNRALAIEPTSAPALYSLGKVYEVKGDYRNGIEYLLGASQVDPNDPGVFLELGNCSLKSKQPEKAAQWYEKSISLDHSFVFAHRQLAIALDSCGRHDSAKTQVSIADSLEAVWKLKARK